MKNRHSNFDLFKSFSFFVPGPKGLGIMFVWFIVGILLGNVVSLVAALALGDGSMEFATMIAYAMMFLPPMMYASLASKKNSFFESGRALDSSHFGRTGGLLLALILVVATFCCGFVFDFITTQLPEPPEWFTKLMEDMVGGNFIINFITVSLFAPFFEEWLCRGMVLRGLLNFKRKDGSRGMNPVWAIVISAAFFAIIHGNIWQGLIAFAAGCLFGFVYYKTGSIKLTMLMHFTNNTISLIVSRIPGLEASDSWREVFTQPSQYWTIFTACFIFLVLALRVVSRIETADKQGNSDLISVTE